VYNFGDIRFRNLRVYAVNNSTFWGDTVKIGISRQISQNVLDLPYLLYSIGRRISVDNFPNIRLVVAKGRCYSKQLNMGDVGKRRVESPLLFASAFDKGRKSAFKRFNGNNLATSCPNLVNFRPVISEFALLKCAIFEAIRPQFDDDLHSSRCRFQTDWKIAILISAE